MDIYVIDVNFPFKILYSVLRCKYGIIKVSKGLFFMTVTILLHENFHKLKKSHACVRILGPLLIELG